MEGLYVEIWNNGRGPTLGKRWWVHIWTRWFLGASDSHEEPARHVCGQDMWVYSSEERYRPKFQICGSPAHGGYAKGGGTDGNAITEEDGMVGNSQLLVEQMKMTLQRRQGRTGKEAAGWKERIPETAGKRGLYSMDGESALPHRRERCGSFLPQEREERLGTRIPVCQS